MRRLPGALSAASLGVGVVLQYVQRTDPLPAHRYYTIWSACASAGTVAAHLARPGVTVPGGLRVGALSGTLLSGAAYATLIAPTIPGPGWFDEHDDTAVRVANVLLHAVGPLSLLWAGPAFPARRPWLTATVSLTFPMTYLTYTHLVRTPTGASSPYDFLDPAIPPRRLLTTYLVLGATHVATARAMLRRVALPGATRAVRFSEPGHSARPGTPAAWRSG